jgi:hypothetical protein
MRLLKKQIKAALGPNWKYVTKIRHSTLARRTNAFLSFPVQFFNYRRNFPYFAIEIVGTMGMGAIIVHTLRLLRHAELNRLIPLIRVRSPLYATSAGENILETYFEIREDRSRLNSLIRFNRVTSEEDYRLLRIDLNISLSDARITFERYLSFNREIESIVRRLLAENGGPFVLAVHYRGTDKALEAAPVEYEDVFEACRMVLAKRPTQRVFLATDEARFSHAIRKAFPRVHFLSYNSNLSTSFSGPRHFSSMSPADKSTEALVNMKLLSCAEHLIRTSSYLSAVSCILNDRIRVLTLGSLDKQSLFPERQIRDLHFLN